MIAGLDVGTTGCKVTVFTAEGENLGREYRDYPVRRAVDVQEVDAVALGESVLDCVKAAQSCFGRIEALGVTSFGEAFVLTDFAGTDPKKRKADGDFVSWAGFCRQRIADGRFVMLALTALFSVWYNV